MDPLLEVKNLQTYFFTYEGVVKAVDDITYEVLPGETLGLVGESGCGKSVSALSLMRLIPDPPGKTVGGEVIFEGEDILKVDMDDMRADPGRQDGDGVPGADDFAESGADAGPAADGDHPAAYGEVAG